MSRPKKWQGNANQATNTDSAAVKTTGDTAGEKTSQATEAGHNQNNDPATSQAGEPSTEPANESPPPEDAGEVSNGKQNAATAENNDEGQHNNPSSEMNEEDECLWITYEEARGGTVDDAWELSGMAELGDTHDAIALADQIDISGKLPVSALANILAERQGDEISDLEFETAPAEYSAFSVFQALYLEGKKLARMSGNLFDAYMAEPVPDDPAAAARHTANRLKRRERGARGKGGGYVRRIRNRRKVAEKELKKAETANS